MPSDLLQDLALDYHKTQEGEYGCPGKTCPGVERLVALCQNAVRFSNTASLARVTELLDGDGFTQAGGDTEFYCQMCGRSRTDGHREACARYVLADVAATLRGQLSSPVPETPVGHEAAFNAGFDAVGRAMKVRGWRADHPTWIRNRRDAFLKFQQGKGQ